ncbi:MAG: DegV family protein [Anaerolineales bacterium]|nr:DegV family protein [Anaerolineales bacterium]
MIRLVTDSTCDLPDGELTQLDVVVVPINIHFDTEEYQERETLGYDDFFAKVNALGIVPKTSQPSPGRFVQEYRRLAAEGATTILSLHVTGKLSGTIGSAELAATEVKDEVDVRVFDSLAGSAGTGFMIREAIELLSQGADADAVLVRWQEIRDHIGICFYLDTLKYARMSGRIGALQHSLASVLSIKPLVKLDAGLLEVAERVRSRRAALDRLLVLAREQAGGQPVNLAVVHAQDRPGADALLARAQEMLDCRQTFVARLASSLVTNLGVGTLGIVLYPVAA